MKVLFVCLGNICRSPLAQGIFEYQCSAHGLNHSADSAGTANYHIGEAPDHRSIKIASLNGIDISRQRCRQFQRLDFDNFDIIVAMDCYNKANILAKATSDAHKNKVISLLETHPIDGYDHVPDPYYDNRFPLVYNLLSKAMVQFIQALEKKEATLQN
jgi:protein-tyrosine phosphatase